MVVTAAAGLLLFVGMGARERLPAIQAARYLAAFALLLCIWDVYSASSAGKPLLGPGNARLEALGLAPTTAATASKASRVMAFAEYQGDYGYIICAQELLTLFGALSSSPPLTTTRNCSLPGNQLGAANRRGRRIPGNLQPCCSVSQGKGSGPEEKSLLGNDWGTLGRVRSQSDPQGGAHAPCKPNTQLEGTRDTYRASRVARCLRNCIFTSSGGSRGPGSMPGTTKCPVVAGWRERLTNKTLVAGAHGCLVRSEKY